MRIILLYSICLGALLADHRSYTPVTEYANTVHPQTTRTSRPAELVGYINENGENATLYTGSYALVIGVGNYKFRNDWHDLPGVEKDVIKVENALKRHGFIVEILKDPTGPELKNGILKFIGERGLEKNNRLLIYFAGHGYLDKNIDGVDMGYIIPSDSPKMESNPALFMQRAIDMREIEGFALKIKSNHAMFVFDSCFSGSLFNVMRGSSAAIVSTVASPVRQFITAGTAQVPDKSVFCEQFIAGLSGEADYTGDGYISGTELGMFLETKVPRESPTKQIPRYGKLPDHNYNQGEILFALSDKASRLTSPANETKPMLAHEDSDGKFTGPSPRARRFYEVGLNALRNGAYLKASKILDQASRIDPGFPLAYAYRAEALLELDDWRQANDIIHLVNTLSDRNKMHPIQQQYLQALSAAMRRDFAKAIEIYKEIERQADEKNKSYIWFNLGRAYEKNEQTDLAIESYRKAAQLDPDNQVAHLRLGVLFSRVEKGQEADQAFTRAYEIYESLVEPEGQAEVMYQRGFFAMRSGNPAEARKFLEQALHLAETAGNKTQEALTLLQLSHAELAEVKYDLAEERAKKAMEIAEIDGDTYLRGLVQLGSVNFYRGNYTEAEKYYRQACDQARRVRARRNLALAQVNLGSLLIQTNKIEEGTLNVREALAFYEEGKYRSEIAQSLRILARAEGRAGDPESALKGLERSLAIARELNKRDQISDMLEESAYLLEKLERYPQAIRFFEESFAINQTLRNKRAATDCLLHWGDSLWRIGNYEEAQKKFDELSKIRATTGLYLSQAAKFLSEFKAGDALQEIEKARSLSRPDNKRTQIELNRASAMAAAIDHSIGDAIAFGDAAVRIARESGEATLLSSALLTQAEVMLAMADPNAALNAALEAQQKFHVAKQYASECRALMIAALASRELHDSKAFGQYYKLVLERFSWLKSMWGDNIYRSYRSRPDIKKYIERLSIDHRG